MDEQNVTTLFGVLAAEPAPVSGVDVELAVRRGRARRRNRRLLESAAAVVATVLVAVGFVAVRDHQQRTVVPEPVGAAKSAPDFFDPMVQYADFGWLPSGFPARSVTNDRERVFLEADPATGTADPISVVLTSKRQMTGDPAPILKPAPPLNGATAYWVTGARTPNPALATDKPTPGGSGPQCVVGVEPGLTELCWEYAPGGWASVTVPDKRGGAAIARRVAAGLRMGLRTPLKWPFHLSGEYAKLTVRETSWSGLAERPHDVSIALDDRPPAQSEGRPGQQVEIGVRPHSAAGPRDGWAKPPNTTFRGHRAYKGVPATGAQVLAVYDIAGLDVTVHTTGLGSRGAEQVFEQLTVFDPDPGVWRTGPLG